MTCQSLIVHEDTGRQAQQSCIDVAFIHKVA